MPRSQKPKRVRQGPNFSEWYREHVSPIEPDRLTKIKFSRLLDESMARKSLDEIQARKGWDILAPHYNKSMLVGPIRRAFEYVSSIVRFSGNENVLSLASGTGI